MENSAFRKFEWSVWILLDSRILHQIPKASGRLERPPNPLPYRTNPPLKISAYVYICTTYVSWIYIFIYMIPFIMNISYCVVIYVDNCMIPGLILLVHVLAHNCHEHSQFSIHKLYISGALLCLFKCFDNKMPNCLFPLTRLSIRKNK